jgi:purine-cytosine permease-like protein
VLIIWLVYSLYRLFYLIYGLRTTPWTEQSKREQLVYWLAAIASSFAFPLAWGLIALSFRQFP